MRLHLPSTLIRLIFSVLDDENLIKKKEKKKKKPMTEMNATVSLTAIDTTAMNNYDDVNGSLVDDWETYKAYTRFYYITDEIFLYANPILIIIGEYDSFDWN